MPDPDAERRPSRRLWFLAALGALAVHAGGITLAIGHLKLSDMDAGLGAAAPGIGIEISSTSEEESDLPVGPDADLSAPSVAVPEQKAVIKETDLPKEQPIESEDADRAVTTDDSKKPKEEEPEKAVTQQTASADSPATQASARQTLEETGQEDKGTGGLGKDNRKLEADFGRRLIAFFELHKRYPEVKNARTVTVKVTFVLNRQGHFASVGVLASSGDAAFDEAAIAMIRRSDPLPFPPPVEITDDRLNYSMDVQFTEQKKEQKKKSRK